MATDLIPFRTYKGQPVTGVGAAVRRDSRADAVNTDPVRTRRRDMEESADYHQATAMVKPHGRVPPMPCPACKRIEIPVLYAGSGPHVARAVSACCQRFIRWIPKALVEGKEQAMGGGIARCLIVGC